MTNQEQWIAIVMFVDRREVFHPRVNVDFRYRFLSIADIFPNLPTLEFDFHRDIIFVISNTHENFPFFVCDYFANRDGLNSLRNSNFQFLLIDYRIDRSQ